MLIFDSDDNYSKNLMLDFDGILVKVENIIINKTFDNYIELDFSLQEVLEIEKMERICEKNIKTVKIYPDFSDKNIFFTLCIKSFMDFNLVHKNYKFYCENKCILDYNDNHVNDFNESYVQYTKFLDINQEEQEKINYFNKRQFEPKWFNDQNIFVENEYNRIKKLTNKKKQIEGNNIFDPSVIKVSPGTAEPEKLLEDIVGLGKVKKEVKRLKAMLEYRKDNNKDINESLHMCFYGNPGTGKTTVARIMAGILYNLGYIAENKCVEVNGLELKGANVGQTSIITKGIIDYAKGGVLFIDEAYTLFDESKNNFGIEAINLLLKEMEDNRDNLIVILAGYYGPMQKLLDSNVGFRSRIKYYFDFEDYSAAELFSIFMNLIRNKHLYVDADAMKEIIIDFKNARVKKGFGNGRYVENFLTKIEEEHILNVSKEISKADILSVKDIIKGVDIFDL